MPETSDDEVRRALKEFIGDTNDALTFEKTEHGKLGYYDASGNRVIKVPNQPNKNYVRVERNSGATVTIALNLKVPLVFDLPVILERTNNDTVLEIVDVDRDPALGAMGGNAPGMAIGPHSHRIGFGNEDPVEARRFEPGLVKRGTALIVAVDPFFYQANGEYKYFYGGAVNLLDHLPSSGNWYWVKIGIATNNELTVAEGTETALGAPLYPDDLIAITFEGVPLAGYKLSDTDTQFLEYNVLDMRPFASGMGFTIDGFGEAVDDQVAGLLVAGTNITLTYDDPLNTITIDASGGGSSNGILVAEESFTEATSSPLTVFTPPANAKIEEVQIDVTIAAAGGSPTASVGIGGDVGRDMATSENNLKEVFLYSVTPLTDVTGTPAAVILTLVPDSQTFTGLVRVKYSNAS